MSRTSAEHLLVWFLRLTGVMLLSAAAAVVLPFAWMSALGDALGLGPLPDAPLVGYLTRSVSALYACLGAGCWFLACDVQRYLPLLRFSVPVTMVFGATLIAIDLASAMPNWWTWTEGVFLAAWTIALGWLARCAGRGV